MKKENAKQLRLDRKIGGKLRQKRLANHQSLDDLHQSTKIQKKYLLSIERGNFQALPGSFYLRAFVKTYANSVGLNGDEFLDRYHDRFLDPMNPSYVDQISKNQLLTEIQQGKVAEHHSLIRRLIPVISIIVASIIVLVSLWLIIAGVHHFDPVQLNDNEASSSGARLVSDSSSKRRAKLESRHIKRRAKRRSTTNTRLKHLHSSSSQINYLVTTRAAKPSLRISFLKGSIWIKNGQRTFYHSVHGADHLVRVRKGVVLTIVLNNTSRVKMIINGKKINLTPSPRFRALRLKFKA